MKVLFVTPWFPNKPEDQHGSYIIDSIRSLIALGVEVHVLYVKTWRPKSKRIDQSLFMDVPVIQECSYFSLPRHRCRVISNFMLTHRVAAVIKKMHSQYHYDLIHAHTELCALPLLALHIKIPTVCTVHGIETCHRMSSGKSGEMIYRAMESVDKLVMVGTPLVRHFSGKLKKMNHIAVVYNGFRKALCEVNHEKNKDIVNIVSVSNLIEGKGIEINIQALSQLNQLGMRNWKYTIVGDGPERRALESLVKQFDLQERVAFVGAQSHDKVYQYLQSADVFSLPSYREAFGVAYLEAMAHGLLVIGVLDQGPSEFIVDRKTGLLVRPKDIGHLVSLMSDILNKKINVTAIAEDGKKFVTENFQWLNHARQLLEVYNSCAGAYK